MTSTRKMIVALPLVALMLAASMAVANHHAEKKAAESPKVIAVKFHADWCGSCKKIGPIVHDLSNKMDTAPVLFVTLDMTTQSSRRQAEFMASALGIGDLWAQYGGKTGMVLLFDAESRQIVGKFDKTMDIYKMGAELKNAIASASEDS